MSDAETYVMNLCCSPIGPQKSAFEKGMSIWEIIFGSCPIKNQFFANILPDLMQISA